MTAAVAKALHPNQKIIEAPFQKVPLTENFDVVIGNPPFGSEKLLDMDRPDLTRIAPNIHGYFFAKSIDALNPGGLAVMVVSRYLLDADTPRHREFRAWMHKHAELLNAVRLPDTAFASTAFTEVVTDVLILQKRHQPLDFTFDSPTQKEVQAWVSERKKALKAADVKVTPSMLIYPIPDYLPEWIQGATLVGLSGETEILANGWFQKYPDKVLGEWSLEGTMYTDKSLTVKSDGEWEKVLPHILDVLEAKPLAIKREEKIHALPMPQLSVEQMGRWTMPYSMFVVPPEVRREAVNVYYHNRFVSPFPNDRVPALEDDLVNGQESVLIGVRLSDKTDWETKTAKPRWDLMTFPASRARIYVAKLEAMIELRDTVRELSDMQLRETQKNTPEMVALRRKMGEQYHRFQKRFGPLRNDANKMLMRNDPSWAMLSSLEAEFEPEITADKAKKTGVPRRPWRVELSEIFHKRTQFPAQRAEHADTAVDALSICMAETGTVDSARLLELTGKDLETIRSELRMGTADALAFVAPDGQWYSRDQWLTGNIGKKIQMLEAAKAQSDEPQIWDTEIAILRDHLPPRIDITQRTVNLEAYWVPEKIMSDFLVHLGASDPQVRRNEFTQKIEVEKLRGDIANWETQDYHLHDLIHAICNHDRIRVMRKYRDMPPVEDQEATALAIEKAEKIQGEWKKWIFADGERVSLLETIYNDTFNVTVPRLYDGQHVGLAGSSREIELRPHQKNFVWRALQSKSVYADHVVGAGKTFATIAAVMEKRRMGQARKPVVVVPNHLVRQWEKDWYRLYPGARILVAGKADMEASNRQTFLAKAAFNDLDAVIMSHSSFNLVPIDTHFYEEYIQQEMDDIEDYIREKKYSKDVSVKELEKSVRAAKDRIERLHAESAKSRDIGCLNFGEIGFDLIVVDEAHEYKNVPYISEMRGVRGMGNPAGSQKAESMMIKSAQARHLGAGIIFLSGTPISNSIAEMYLIQKYMNPEALEERGIRSFDAWVSLFANVEEEFGFTLTGQYKPIRSLASFNNLPELVGMYREYTDVVSQNDIQRLLREHRKRAIPMPRIRGGKAEIVVCPMSPAQRMAVGEEVGASVTGEPEFSEGSILYRLDNLPKRPGPGEDNILVIINDLKKVNLDIRAFDPSYEPEPGESTGKLDVAAKRIHEIYWQWNEDRGTQLVFLDFSTPKKLQKKDQDEVDQKLAALRDADVEDASDEILQKAESAMEWLLERYTKDEIEEFLRVSQGKSVFSAYDDLKAKLVEMGIPANEVAFIHDAHNDELKADLFEAVRHGQVRVLIGSTAKMGPGMNVQDRLVAEHHLDAPYRPTDVEQRIGRIIRQGNQLLKKYGKLEVDILYYVTENSTDAGLWQILETKKKFIDQVRYWDGSRTVFDPDAQALDPAAIKAQASGNEVLLLEVPLRTQVKKLTALRNGFYEEKARQKRNLEHMYSSRQWFIDNEAGIADFQNSLESLYRIFKNAPEIKEDKQDGFIPFGINGRLLNVREFREELMRAVQKVERSSSAITRVGFVNGLQVDLYQRYVGGDVQFIITKDEHGDKLRVESTAFDPNGAHVNYVQRFQNAIEKNLDYAAKKRAEQKELDDRIPKIVESLEQSFEREEELDIAMERHALAERLLRMRIRNFDDLENRLASFYLKEMTPAQKIVSPGDTPPADGGASVVVPAGEHAQYTPEQVKEAEKKARAFIRKFHEMFARPPLTHEIIEILQKTGMSKAKVDALVESVGLASNTEVQPAQQEEDLGEETDLQPDDVIPAERSASGEQENIGAPNVLPDDALPIATEQPVAPEQPVVIRDVVAQPSGAMLDMLDTADGVPLPGLEGLPNAVSQGRRNRVSTPVNQASLFDDLFAEPVATSEQPDAQAQPAVQEHPDAQVQQETPNPSSVMEQPTATVQKDESKDLKDAIVDTLAAKDFRPEALRDRIIVQAVGDERSPAGSRPVAPAQPDASAQPAAQENPDVVRFDPSATVPIPAPAVEYGQLPDGMRGKIAENDWPLLSPAVQRMALQFFLEMKQDWPDVWVDEARIAMDRRNDAWRLDFRFMNKEATDAHAINMEPGVQVFIAGIVDDHKNPGAARIISGRATVSPQDHAMEIHFAEWVQKQEGRGWESVTKWGDRDKRFGYEQWRAPGTFDPVESLADLGKRWIDEASGRVVRLLVEVDTSRNTERQQMELFAHLDALRRDHPGVLFHAVVRNGTDKVIATTENELDRLNALAGKIAPHVDHVRQSNETLYSDTLDKEVIHADAVFFAGLRREHSYGATGKHYTKLDRIAQNKPTWLFLENSIGRSNKELDGEFLERIQLAQAVSNLPGAALQAAVTPAEATTAARPAEATTAAALQAAALQESDQTPGAGQLQDVGNAFGKPDDLIPPDVLQEKIPEALRDLVRNDIAVLHTVFPDVTYRNVNVRNRPSVDQRVQVELSNAQNEAIELNYALRPNDGGPDEIVSRTITLNDIVAYRRNDRLYEWVARLDAVGMGDRLDRANALSEPHSTVNGVSTVILSAILGRQELDTLRRLRGLKPMNILMTVMLSDVDVPHYWENLQKSLHDSLENLRTWKKEFPENPLQINAYLLDGNDMEHLEEISERYEQVEKLLKSVADVVVPVTINGRSVRMLLEESDAVMMVGSAPIKDDRQGKKLSEWVGRRFREENAKYNRPTWHFTNDQTVRLINEKLVDPMRSNFRGKATDNERLSENLKKLDLELDFSATLDAAVVEHIGIHAPVVLAQAKNTGNTFEQFMQGSLMGAVSNALLELADDPSRGMVRRLAINLLQNQDGMTGYREKIGRMIFDAQRAGHAPATESPAEASTNDDDDEIRFTTVAIIPTRAGVLAVPENPDLPAYLAGTGYIADGENATDSPAGHVTENNGATLRDVPPAVLAFLPSSQIEITRLGLRGEEADFFWDKMQELRDIIEKMPKLYATDGQKDRTIAFLHYFLGDAHWYVMELDKTEQHQAFGLADLGVGFPELGYFDLRAVVAAGAEMDYHFAPRTLRELKLEAGEDLAPETVPESVVATSMGVPIPDVLQAWVSEVQRERWTAIWNEGSEIDRDLLQARLHRMADWLEAPLPVSEAQRQLLDGRVGITLRSEGLDLHWMLSGLNADGITAYGMRLQGDQEAVLGRVDLRVARQEAPIVVDLTEPGPLRAVLRDIALPPEAVTFADDQRQVFYRGGQRDSQIPDIQSIEEIWEYETDTLNNSILITQEAIDNEYLKLPPVRSLQWLTIGKEEASEYGAVHEVIVNDPVILLRDPNGGVLVAEREQLDDAMARMDAEADANVSVTSTEIAATESTPQIFAGLMEPDHDDMANQDAKQEQVPVSENRLPVPQWPADDRTYESKMKKAAKLALDTGEIMSVEDMAIAVFHKHGIKTSGNFVPPVVEAVRNMDIGYLRSLIGHNSGNPASQEIFERMTGVKLGKTQKNRVRQLDEWAGIDHEQRADMVNQKPEELPITPEQQEALNHLFGLPSQQESVISLPAKEETVPTERSRLGQKTLGPDETHTAATGSAGAKATETVMEAAMDAGQSAIDAPAEKNGNLAAPMEQGGSIMPDSSVPSLQESPASAPAARQSREIGPDDRVVELRLWPLHENINRMNVPIWVKPEQVQRWCLVAVLQDKWEIPYYFPENVDYAKVLESVKKRLEKYPGCVLRDLSLPDAQDPSPKNDIMKMPDAPVSKAVASNPWDSLAPPPQEPSTAAESTQSPIASPAKAEEKAEEQIQKPLVESVPLAGEQPVNDPQEALRKLGITRVWDRPQGEQKVDERYIQRILQFPQTQKGISEERAVQWLSEAQRVSQQAMEMMAPYMRRDPRLRAKWEGRDEVMFLIDHAMKITGSQIAHDVNHPQAAGKRMMLGVIPFAPTPDMIRGHVLEDHILDLTMEKFGLQPFQAMMDLLKNPDIGAKLEMPLIGMSPDLVLWESPEHLHIVDAKSPLKIPVTPSRDYVAQLHAYTAWVRAMLQPAFSMNPATVRIDMHLAWFDLAKQDVLIRQVQEIPGHADALIKTAKGIQDVVMQGMIPEERMDRVRVNVELTPEIQRDVEALVRIRAMEQVIEDTKKTWSNDLRNRMGSDPDAWPKIPQEISGGSIRTTWARGVREDKAIELLSSQGIPRDQVETPVYDTEAMVKALEQSGINPNQFVIERKLDTSKILTVMEAYNLPKSEVIEATPSIVPKVTNEMYAQALQDAHAHMPVKGGPADSNGPADGNLAGGSLANGKSPADSRKVLTDSDGMRP
nr:DUF2958 domain-containing protein [Igneacidithiobacillus copahuensis]